MLIGQSLVAKRMFHTSASNTFAHAWLRFIVQCVCSIAPPHRFFPGESNDRSTDKSKSIHAAELSRVSFEPTFVRLVSWYSRSFNCDADSPRTKEVHYEFAVIVLLYWCLYDRGILIIAQGIFQKWRNWLIEYAKGVEIFKKILIVLEIEIGSLRASTVTFWKNQVTDRSNS